MKIALFSDIITWVATGEIADAPYPGPDKVIAEGSMYTNLSLQGGTALLDPQFPQYDPDIKAAYVLDGSVLVPAETVTNIKVLDTPVSTQGA